MAEVKNKIVTVEALKTVHDYDEDTFFKKAGGEISGNVWFPNEVTIQGKDTDNVEMNVFTAASYNDNTAVGYDRYYYENEDGTLGKGNLNLYGTDIRLWSRDGNLVAEPLGVNKVLWSGSLQMLGDEECVLTNNISSQINGVVLVWSAWADGDTTAQDFAFATHFIPKWFGANFAGKGIDFPLMRQSAYKVGSKYLYIRDEKIVGQANNAATGTANGITYDNGFWCLRAVIGV